MAWCMFLTFFNYPRENALGGSANRAECTQQEITTTKITTKKHVGNFANQALQCTTMVNYYQELPMGHLTQ